MAESVHTHNAGGGSRQKKGTQEGHTNNNHSLKLSTLKSRSPFHLNNLKAEMDHSHSPDRDKTACNSGKAVWSIEESPWGVHHESGPIWK